MQLMRKVLSAVWSKVRSFYSLVHGWDDVSATYGDNPNDISDEQRLLMRGAASNIVGGSSIGGGF